MKALVDSRYRRSASIGPVKSRCSASPRLIGAPSAERIDISIRNAQLAHLGAEPIPQDLGCDVNSCSLLPFLERLPDRLLREQFGIRR